MSLPSDSSPETPGFMATFIIYLDTYTKTTTENNGKAKTKEVKSTKVKELVFQVSESNYIEFLTTILMKHDKSHYRITERKKYTFKRAEAMDVDNQADYAEMAKKLISKEPRKVKIFVDISSLTSMLLLRTVQDLTREATPLTPVPVRTVTSLPVTSPVAPTPSTLTHFLNGIGAGPDILVDMADQDLARVGLSAGEHYLAEERQCYMVEWASRKE
ncbi:hypothetical protein DFJ58DRAFT_846247 [Suillus subalutaceus]|uniref:uncharacterized protein n=1 Tax=Suillus subalutaceus TaxID=48586 RepID=UPI001B8819F1|nr:uncharacterized protein DFJ58DRAFT_846247 [Suillus subalutaceus]KAG1837964.1 hypothetical protein DFJ58DRAFT_846247 [Suillus subalutaceus]